MGVEVGQIRRRLSLYAVGRDRSFGAALGQLGPDFLGKRGSGNRFLGNELDQRPARVTKGDVFVQTVDPASPLPMTRSATTP